MAMMSAQNDIRNPPDEFRGARVLLVDDEEVTLLLTATALREFGFEVHECNGGDQALRSLPHWQPDVVVLDALMPGRDGFQTCEALRNLPGFERLPVLLLTGLDDEDSIARAYRVGATDFFVKDNRWTLLAGRLRYILRSDRVMRELERNKTRLARAQDIARMGSFDWRVGSFQVHFSSEAKRVFALAPDYPLTFRKVLRLLERSDMQHATGILRDAMHNASVFQGDFTFHFSRTVIRIFHLEAEPEFSESGQLLAYSGVLQDVTERRLAENRIQRLANFDSLTGLPNRRQMIIRSERALDNARRHGHKTALLLIDLDRFKVINDTLGHSAGDELLIEVSKRLRSCLRHSDKLLEMPIESAGSRMHLTLEAVGRLGGDEFVALLPEVQGPHDAEIVAHRVLHALRDPVVLSGGEYFVTASIGVALYPHDGQSVADLLRHADMAMYAVKGSGRNSARFYQPSLAGRNRDRLELETALHKAVERNELVLFYQPKIDLHLGQCVGVEALMRWRRGASLVSPAEFIPLAEETGLIGPMSEWAIKEAAQQSRRWRDTFGFVGSIAVNIPSQLFERSDMVDVLSAATTEADVPTSVIQFEITETGLMKDLQKVIPSLHRLNGVGVDMAIDDFGTGYSSLAYLSSLPISELKVDASFVRDIGVTAQSNAIVGAIIALAHSLNLRVVAEGVENLRQVQVLARLGCSLMQGYYFARPMPAEDLEAWLQNFLSTHQDRWHQSRSAGEAILSSPSQFGALN